MRIRTLVKNHFFILAVLLTTVLLFSTYGLVYRTNQTPKLEGIHAMADGTVMNKYGEIISDAKILQDGSIVDAQGDVIGSMYLGTRFSTNTESVPQAKREPELIELYDGDVYELTAGYVQKEVGNRVVRMLAYNGSIPGPIIKAKQNAEVTINFNNNTDIEQTVHSHGIRIDNQFDGTPGYTQKVVQPGESFTYKVHFPDAGVFWYHPHVREDYAQEMGLYGNYIVEPTNPEYWSPVNRDVPLVVDDILIANDTIASFYKELTNFALLGRYGNEYLVNGEVGYTMNVKKGEVIRLYVTNVANARTFNLGIPNAQIKRVGADLGKYEHETFVDSVLISPAERVVIEVYFPTEGNYTLMHTTPTEQIELSKFVASGLAEPSYQNDFQTLRDNADVINQFIPLKKYIYKAPDKKLALTVKLTGPKIDHSKHVHMAQGALTGTTTEGLPNIQWDDVGQSDMTNTTQKITWELMDTQTRKINMDIDDWNFKKSDLVKIEITNDPNAEHIMQHPIHFHGQRFVVLDRNGVRNENMVWKDTTMVKPGETITILVEMSNLGMWMAHCHIAEHLEAGMMLNFTVADENGVIPNVELQKTLERSM